MEDLNLAKLNGIEARCAKAAAVAAYDSVEMSYAVAFLRAYVKLLPECFGISPRLTILGRDE